MLAIAIRIAQRIGIPHESSYTKCFAFEAEMRRRLWWALILFDTRICEMSDTRSAMLASTWDCKPPRNASDFNLHPEMKEPPTSQSGGTEATFAVVRGEISDFVRHSAFYLDFANPALKNVSQSGSQSSILTGSETDILERKIEDKYLRNCNLETPLHFMTVWTARCYIAKNRLVEYYSKNWNTPASGTDEQRNVAVSYAIDMLNSDTELMASPLIKGFRWMANFYFPFPAYIHITQDLRRRPFSGKAEQAWEAMDRNFDARFNGMEQRDSPIFRIFAKPVLQAWEARENAEKGSGTGRRLSQPTIVTDIRRRLAAMGSTTDEAASNEKLATAGTGVDEMSMPMPNGFADRDLLYYLGFQGFDEPQADAYPNIFGLDTADSDLV